MAIDEIREDIVILKGGGLRAILMASPRNLELESIEGQGAVIAAYADFLNSFDWPMQIIIHSRRLDINPYLKMLEERLKAQTSELLKIQTAEYVEFIKSFVTLSDIMVKRFYVAIPFDPIEAKGAAVGESLFTLLGQKPKAAPVLSEEKFRERKNQLMQRVEHIILALSHVGIKSAQLTTEELLELFYNLYNPEELEKKDLRINQSP